MKETRAGAHIRKMYPHAHITRIESWTGTGIFDTNVCIDHVESWVEMKQVVKPKTARGKIKPTIRPAQVAWERLHRQAGGKTFVALMVGTDFYLIEGRHVSELKSGITQERLQELKLPEYALTMKWGFR